MLKLQSKPSIIWKQLVMSDKSLVLALPEDLLDRAQAAHLGLRQVLIEALEQKLPRTADDSKPSAEEVESAVRQSVQRVASGEADLRVLGLHTGTTLVSDDFDDPHSDEFRLRLGG
jgi:hypothetical protein